MATARLSQALVKPKSPQHKPGCGEVLKGGLAGLVAANSLGADKTGVGGSATTRGVGGGCRAGARVGHPPPAAA